MEAHSWADRAPVHVSLDFESASEAEDLKKELMMWTPTGGWSALAASFFEALSEAASKGRSQA